MSVDRLRTCLTARVQAGVFSQDKADMMEALARDLEREYREEMGPQLAGAAAVAEAARIVQERALFAKRQDALQIAAQATALEYAARHSKGSGAGAMSLLTRDIWEEAPHSNVEARREVVLGKLLRQFTTGLNAYRSKAAGLAQDKVGIRNLVRALYGEPVSDGVAATAAKEWQATADYAAKRFIAAGGELMAREDWRLPQTHDADRIKAAGFEAWRDFITQHLDPKTWTRLEELRRSLAGTRGEVEKELGAARSLRAAVMAKAKDARSRFESSQNSRRSADARLGQLTKQMAEVERELKTTQQRGFQAADARRVAAAQVEGRGTTLEAMQKAAAKADARAREADAAASRLKARRDELRRQMDEATAKRTDAEARGKAESGQWQAYEEDLRRLEDRIAGLERNRDVITKRIDGEPAAINPAHREKVLRDIYDEMVTDLPPAARTGAMGVSRHNAQRFFVFKDAESWLAYNDRFGSGAGGIYDTLVGHLDAMARDIALTEVLGPKHSATVRALIEQAAREEGQKPGGMLSRLNPMSLVEGPKAIGRTYDVLAGRLGGGTASAGATFMSGVRSWLTAAKLGSAVISAVPSDSVTLAWAAKANGMEATKVLATTLRQLNPANEADRLAALRMGIVASSVSDTALATARFREDSLTGQLANRLNIPSWAAVLVDPQRMATTVIRAQGLAAWTNAAKNAFMIEFMGHVADQVGKPLAEVSKPLRRTLEKYGITPRDWDIIRQAPLMDFQGAKVFDPEAVSSRALGEKIMEIAVQERAFAVLEPDARVRQITTGGTRANKFVGQIVRSVALFKSFTVTMMLTHMTRAAMQESLGSRLAYFGALSALLTMSGAVSMQAKALVQGKDPRPMDTPEFWGAAMLQGGALGYFGDFLSSATGRDGNTIGTALAGPVLGLVNDAGRLVLPNLRQLYEGEPTKFGAELTRFARNNTPGGNLWYARAVLDRALWDQIQTLADPDYRRSFARMERRARNDFGQRYWWRPGEVTPDRAPDLGAAAGR